MAQPEKAAQRAIVQLLETLGAKVYVSGTKRPKGDFQGTRQTPGIPDLEAFLPAVVTGRNRLLKIEVKAPGGRLSRAQAAYRDECGFAGVEHVIGGLSEVIAWLEVHGYVTEARGHVTITNPRGRPGPERPRRC